MEVKENKDITERPEYYARENFKKLLSPNENFEHPDFSQGKYSESYREEKNKSIIEKFYKKLHLGFPVYDFDSIKFELWDKKIDENNFSTSKVKATLKVTDGNRTVMVKNYNNKNLSLPGGTVNDGEPPIEGAKREFIEETTIELPEDIISNRDRVATNHKMNLYISDKDDEKFNHMTQHIIKDIKVKQNVDETQMSSFIDKPIEFLSSFLKKSIIETNPDNIVEINFKKQKYFILYDNVHKDLLKKISHIYNFTITLKPEEYDNFIIKKFDKKKFYEDTTPEISGILIKHKYLKYKSKYLELKNKINNI
jgi:8-oxo-dGTP pyrophosphatase MutT (NUDIX family)